MSLTRARAFLPPGKVLIKPMDTDQDYQALCTLARWANRFSPVVAVDPPDGLLIDITGCQRVFKGERRLINQLADSVEKLGFLGRVSVAPTFGCAWAVARHGRRPRCIIDEGGARSAIEPLPVRALRVGTDIEASLHEVGIDRTGDLFAIPRRQLAARFGDELLLRLDQALGQTIEMINPVRPREAPRVDIHFNGATTRFDAIALATRQLIERLVDQLRTRECGARQVDVMLDRVDCQPQRVNIELSRPNRNAKHLWSLIRPKLEKVHLGFGVERVRITASRTEPLPHEQVQYTSRDEPLTPHQIDQHVGELLDTLVNRLGHERVTMVEPLETHIPERAYRYKPGSLSHHRNPSKVASRTSAPPHAITGDRPSRLFHPPRPVEVMAVTPEGPPLWMKYDGVETRLTGVQGPQRIEREWWTEPYKKVDHGRFDSQARDYFKAQDEQGRWWWLYRDLSINRWFIHGQWA